MKLTDLSGWHPFVYTQLYPAVLGSILYDVLQIPFRTNEPLDLFKLSVVFFYCVDYLHLRVDLKADTNPHKIDTSLDALIAVLLGAAYWASEADLRWAYGLWLAVTVIFPLYFLRTSRRRSWLLTRTNLLANLIPIVLLLLGFWLHGGVQKETLALSGFAVATFFSYAVLVFGLVEPTA